MGRRRKGNSYSMKVNIPEATYHEFERALTANFSNKPEYGLRSQIITTLINEWLAKLKVKQQEQNLDQPRPE